MSFSAANWARRGNGSTFGVRLTHRLTHDEKFDLCSIPALTLASQKSSRGHDGSAKQIVRPVMSLLSRIVSAHTAGVDCR